MKELFISDLPKEGTVTLLAVVASKESRDKKNGEAYLSLTLVDKTGTVDGKIWDDVELMEPRFKVNDVVKIQGAVGAYKNQSQITIKRLRLAAPEEVDRADYVRCSTRSPSEMMVELGGFIDGVSDEWTRKVLRSVLADPKIAGKLLEAPAAKKIHHAFGAGLLEHVCSMLGLAKKVSEHYPKLSMDLLTAGVVLHDLAKCVEMTIDLAISYSVEGQLVGHVAMGYALFEKHCDLVGKAPDDRTRIKIAHLIVSHHGQVDWGALKVPAFPEAIALHYIDNLDAKLEQSFRIIAESADEDFTPYEAAAQSALYRR